MTRDGAQHPAFGGVEITKKCQQRLMAKPWAAHLLEDFALDLDAFLQPALGQSRAGIHAVPAKARERFRNERKPVPQPAQTQIILEIHADFIAQVHQVTRGDNRAPKKTGGGLDEAAVIEQDIKIEPMVLPASYELFRLIHKIALAIDDVGIWIFRNVTGHSRQRAG